MAADEVKGGPMAREWTLVMPLKPLSQAKSRLAADAGEELRPALALAFALDTVCAALACPAVAGVAVVTLDPVASVRLAELGARIVPDSPRRGLNAAVEHGERAVRDRHGEPPVAALNADLPALRPEELGRVLEAARRYPRAFVADAAGVGTTLLAAAGGVGLEPGFGPGSRARHRLSGAVELAPGEVPSVRQDVDTGADLRAALELGVGPFTADCARGPARGLRTWPG